jgi:hypothetical protein
MAGASSHLRIFFPGRGRPEGRVYGRRLVFVSVRTIKRQKKIKTFFYKINLLKNNFIISNFLALAALRCQTISTYAANSSGVID